MKKSFIKERSSAMMPVSVMPELKIARRRARSESFAGTILLMLTTALASMATSGAMSNYVQPWLKPYVLASAAVLGVMAAWTLFKADNLLEVAEETATKTSPNDFEEFPMAKNEILAVKTPKSRNHFQGHHNHYKLPVSAGFLLLPALLFALACPSSLGVYAATSGTSVAQISQLANNKNVKFDKLPKNKVANLTVKQLNERYFWGSPADLENITIKLDGFVTKPDSLPDGQWSINRFQIFCCAADATLISVYVNGNNPPQVNTWVQIEGKVDLYRSDNKKVLFIPSSVKKIKQPENPYL